ncbi:MAG: hypothetical protein ACYCOU_24485, partial [Sulfobacillus sp.]
LYHTARTCGQNALWMDGRACVRTPQGFLDHLASALILSDMSGSGPDSPMQSLLHAIETGPVLLVIDNFEALSAIAEWWTYGFLGSLPDRGVLAVLAARTFAIPSTTLHSPADKHWVQVPLDPLSQSEAHSLVVRTLPSFPWRIRQQIVTKTGGHPLALTLVTERIHAQQTAMALDPQPLADPLPNDAPPFYQVLSSHWLRELVDETLQPAVDVLTLIGSADQDILSAGIGQPLTTHQYFSLASLSFIQPGHDGLVLHDLVRTYLFRDMAGRQPDYMRTLRDRLAAALVEQFQSGSSAQRAASARRLLNLSLEALRAPAEYADLSSHAWHYHQTPYQPDDLPYLQTMLEDWANAYAIPGQQDLYQRFLVAFAARFPQDIRVLRNDQGKPAAASFFTLVHQQSADLLVRYFPDEIRECLTSEELGRTPDQSSTYYAILVCVDRRDPSISVSELTGILIRGGLSLLGSGTRVTLVATNPQLMQLLRTLGFAIKPTKTHACDVQGLPAHVCTLDLTGGRFPLWIRYLIKKTDFPDLPTEAFVPLHLPHQEIQAETVRRALALIRTPHLFHQNDLVFKLPLAPEELRLVLLRALTGRDPSLLRFVSNDLLTVLQATFLALDPSVTQVAAGLNLSRASYYRRLRSGLEGLAHWLSTLSEAADPPQTSS